VDEFQGETGFGNEAGFEASGGADEADLSGVGVAELAGDGEGGDDVAASASAGDEDAESG